jgi:hypothetical protein
VLIKADSMTERNESLLSFGSSEEHERRGCMCFRSLFDNLRVLCNHVKDFTKKAVEMGRSDPRKVIFAIKMGLALSLVSLLLFWEESFDAVGQYSIWAILTVIVMFEFSIGSAIWLSMVIFDQKMIFSSAGEFWCH